MQSKDVSWSNSINIIRSTKFSTETNTKFILNMSSSVGNEYDQGR